jgi:hypothetical protein
MLYTKADGSDGRNLFEDYRYGYNYTDGAPLIGGIPGAAIFGGWGYGGTVTGYSWSAGAPDHGGPYLYSYATKWDASHEAGRPQ